MSITRVKFCGMTRARDVESAVEAGANAIGFVCHLASPRYVAPGHLKDLGRSVPLFVTPVLLFVNADTDRIERALEAVPNALLQFHGDETAAQCARYARPYLRAIRMLDGFDLLDCEREFASASGLLADTPTEGYGGSGRGFDWARVPAASARTKPLVLAGGLTAMNVAAAVALVRPYAVDVSSGIEESPAIQSVEKLQRFIAAVRAADFAREPR